MKPIHPDDHGLRAWWRGCKCPVCRSAWSKYNYQRQRARKNGSYVLVSAKRAQEHLEKFESVWKLSKVSGINRSTLERIRDGVRHQIRPETEKKVLALTKEQLELAWPKHTGGGSLIPARKAKELVEDLLVSGFTLPDLGRKANLKAPLRLLGKKYVRAWNAKRIEKIYRTMGEAA